MNRLQGKVAVVTGASKGIGAGIAKSLAAEGAAVVVNYASDKDGATRTAAAITDAGGKAIAVQGSVSEPAAVQALFAEAKNAYGTVDILVNNAGVYAFGALETITPAEFHRQFDINVLGLLLVTQEAARHMGTGGSIINIGSVVSRMTFPQTAVYSATKGAVDAITGVLAKELGPKGIRVNSVNPGGVDTEGFRVMDSEGGQAQQMASMTPLGRIGTPDDIARVALFLASEDAGWVTGETIIASGGMR